VPYSFFLALQYVVIFGKVFHLRDTDFWLDFNPLWIWFKQNSCLSSIFSTIDLIKTAKVLLKHEVARCEENEIPQILDWGIEINNSQDEDDTDIWGVSFEVDSIGDQDDTEEVTYDESRFWK